MSRKHTQHHPAGQEDCATVQGKHWPPAEVIGQCDCWYQSKSIDKLSHIIAQAQWDNG